MSSKHRISVNVRLKPQSSSSSSEIPEISADERGVITKQKVFAAVDSVVTGSNQSDAYDAIAAPLLARLRDGYEY